MIRNRAHGIPVSGGLGRGGYQVAGRGRSPSAAQLLLQKANTQLRGERVPVKPKEEDELANYLNSLTQKTSLQAKSVNYEEYGDISISSGADAMTPTALRTPSPATGPGSKFLKKKAAPPVEDTGPYKKSSDGKAYSVKPSESGTTKNANTVAGRVVGSGDAAAGKSVSGATATAPKVGTSGSMPGMMKKGGFQMSSTLSKASALAERITSRSAVPAAHRKHRSQLDSETDESASPGPDRRKDIKARNSGSRPSSADSSVGRDGKKFLKRGSFAQNVNQTEDGGKSPSRPRSRERAKSKSPAEPKVKKSSSKLHMPSNIYLTSEEESMAEFIAALSGSDESKSTKGKSRQTSGKSKRHVSHSPSLSPSPQRRSRRQTPSPGSLSISRRHSQPKNKKEHHAFHRLSSSDSIVSEVADSNHERIMIADSISLDLEEPLEIKLLDVGTLGPVMLTTPEPAPKSQSVKTPKKAKVTPFKKTSSPSVKKKKKSKERKPEKNKATSRLFQSFGVQSVEDLLSEKENTESEIPTEPIAGRKRNQSTSQIVTEIGGSQATSFRQVSYSEDFDTSISEKIADGREQEDWGKKVGKSSVKSENSEEETRVDYSEDFASETLSVAKEDSDRSSHYRYSDEDQTETSVTLSDASSRPHRPTAERKLVVEQKSVEIQTALPSGLNYQWMSHTGVSVMGPSYGLAGVDPTPIASTVISADALETLTSYSPATLAIHDMLKQQIELIKQFASAHQRLYHSLSSSNEPDYKYTTLEGTKSIIKKHSRPRLTMKQALKMVDEEMNRQ